MTIAWKKSKGMQQDTTARSAAKRVIAAATIASGTIQQLFDSNHTAQQVINGTPGNLRSLLTARGFALLRHPSGGLATALRIDDSVCNWAPAAPTRLYFATHDEQAVNANTWHCQADFAASGRHVPVINLGTPDYQRSRHLGSNVAATARIVSWFSALSR